MGSPSEDSFTDIYRRFFSLEEDAEEEEAVTSASGCFNDINTLEASPLLESYIYGTIPKTGFHANRNDYEHGYYLGDGLYPEYSIIVKTFSETFDEKKKADLVEHAWAIHPMRYNGDDEEDSEEEQGEEFEDGNFEDVGLDAGENEEEEGENDSEDGE
ncbi:acidic leucine-rich nuclear phosphoprotein 32 family member B-like [Helianthus annuus]|uniref:acidic leucine-rich nuclear phosphoprotein 32 family member B-like n=1 Tax=Helianthus annuus TaxID=4232 RepID=UPI000B8FD250|nr:acidic leucine-rich nuclear phosphoprotein 32 family member B-like [Helianthus annuus]